MTLRPPVATAALAATLLLLAPASAIAQNGPVRPTVAVGPSAATAADAAATGPAPAAPSAQPARAPLDVQLVPMDGTAVRAGRITTTFEAPFSVVSAVLADFAHYNEFLPRVRQSRVVARRRGQADVYLQVPLLENLGVLWALTTFTITRAPDRMVVDGRSVNGNVNRFECRFEATAVPGTNRTQVTLQVLGIPSFPWPTGMLSNQQGRWGARGLEAMRDRAERLAAARAGGGSSATTPAAPAVTATTAVRRP